MIKTIMHSSRKKVFLLTLPLVIVPSLVSATTFSPINAQVEYGSRGDNVVRLQTFLAANTSVYPEGLITGFYGALTEKAVRAFQELYNIAAVGRVGPITLAKINALINTNTWGDKSLRAPTLSQVTKNVGRDAVTFSWNTDEPTTAKVFYDENFVQMDWGNIDSSNLRSLTGSIALGDGVLRTNNTISILGLKPNTTYHYILVATDSDGNVSVFSPNETFKTTQ